MTYSSKLSRRTLLSGVAATALAAAAGRFANPIAAHAGSVPAAGANASADILGDGIRSGFRACFSTRLDALERTAGLSPIPRDDQFRHWARESLRRLEHMNEVTPDARGDARWRTWVYDRLSTVEKSLVPALRFPFYTHMPIGTAADEHGPLLRQRIREGSCNGIFLYGSEYVPMAPTAAMDSITSSGPPVPILMSPKNVSDPVSLAAWMNYWAARPEWIPYIRVAFWQEPQGDFGGYLQPPVSAYHDGVRTLADAADRVGIASVAHVETWHLHPVYQPDGGVPRLLELLQPVIHRLGGGVSWSVYVFNEKPEAGNDFVNWMNLFMDEYFPYSTYGIGAYGDSLHVSTPFDDPARVERAGRVGSMYDDLDLSRARFGGYYALPVGPDPTRSFWDGRVEHEATEAVGDLEDGLRITALRARDRAALDKAERAAERGAGTAPGRD